MEMYEMLTWMTEDTSMTGENSSVHSLEGNYEKFYVWEKWLKQIAYKEEYQNTEAENYGKTGNQGGTFIRQI